MFKLVSFSISGKGSQFDILKLILQSFCPGPLASRENRMHNSRDICRRRVRCIDPS